MFIEKLIYLVKVIVTYLAKNVQMSMKAFDS